MYTLYWYPRCSTCKKAKAWLDQEGVAVETVDMVQTPPAAETIAGWLTVGDYPIRRFFNTSGQKYRELNLKDRVADLTIEEASSILSSDGMLIKRPLLLKDGRVLAVGFKENDYEGATR